MKETISVIVPVYRAETFLARCLDSLKNQSYRDLEIWLVDDGSPDESGAICDRYAEEDSRFHVIHQENQGVSRARNAALKEVTGKYVGFVDADDWVEPELYQTLWETLSQAEECRKEKSDDDKEKASESPVLSMCAFYKDEDTAYYPLGCREDSLFSREKALSFILNDKLSSLWNKLFLTSRIREKGLAFHPSITVFEDLLFVWQYLEGGSLLYRPRLLYHYRQSQGSISRSGFSPARMTLLDALDQMNASVAEEQQVLKKGITGKRVYGSMVLLIMLLSGKASPEHIAEYQPLLQKNIREGLRILWSSSNYSIPDKAAAALLSVWPELGAALYRLMFPA